MERIRCLHHLVNPFHVLGLLLLLGAEDMGGREGGRRRRPGSGEGPRANKESGERRAATGRSRKEGGGGEAVHLRTLPHGAGTLSHIF